jgi:hypothetical protein
LEVSYVQAGKLLGPRKLVAGVAVVNLELKLHNAKPAKEKCGKAGFQSVCLDGYIIPHV